MAPDRSGLRIALLGAGAWGRLVLRDLRLAGCDVDVLGRGDVIEDAGGVAGVVIATPGPTHAELARRALALDVPVLVEKPLALTAREAAALAERGGARLFVGDKWRWHPAVVALREIADHRTLGAVRALRTMRVWPMPPHDDEDVVLTLATHDMAVAHEVLGAVPPVLGATARRAQGRTIALRGRLGIDPVVEIEVAADAPAKRTRLELVCEHGSAVLPDSRAAALLLVAPDGRTNGEVELSGPPPLEAQLRAFAAHCAGGPPPRNTAADHVTFLQAVEDLQRAAADV